MRWSLTIAVLFFSFYVLGQNPNQTQHTTPSADLTKFWLYTPPGYDPATPTPLLISLHGQVEIGDDLNLLVNNGAPIAPPKLIYLNRWDTDLPFIVVSPQLKRDFSVPPADQDWDPQIIDIVVEYVKTLRNVDLNRIYVTGLSLGAQGCWYYATNYPQKVAAVVPISGKTDIVIDDACELVDIPIWIFHGSDDRLLTPQFPIDMVNAIIACGPGAYTPHLTLMHPRGHEGWNEMYDYTSGYPIFEWMLQFSKGDFSNKPPFVSAGGDLKVLTTDGSFYLYGDYFDSDGTISTVEWTKLSGPSVVMGDPGSQFLKLSQLEAGTYTFRLRVVDNLGLQSTDDVVVQAFATLPSNTPAVTRLVWMNGATNQDIGEIYNEQIINKATLGVTDFNVKAEKNTHSQLVRYRVNGNQNSKQGSGATVLIKNQSGVPEWELMNIEYNICATAYGSSFSGPPGISRCFKVSVYDEPLKEFYPKPGTELSVLTNWGTETNGTGDPPESFLNNFQTFIVPTSAFSNNSWTVSGVESEVQIQDDGTLTLNNSFSGKISLGASAILNVNTNSTLDLEEVDPTSTINFQTNATTIPGDVIFGNLTLSGPGTKVLPPNTTSVLGNLIIEDDVLVNGSSASTIQLTGNLQLNESGEFDPTTPFSLDLTAGIPHTFQVQSTEASFQSLHIRNNSETTLTHPGSTILHLNDGLVVDDNSTFMVGDARIMVEGGSINPSMQTGRLGFDHGQLLLSTNSSLDSYLALVEGYDTLNAVHLHATGAGGLQLLSTLNISDSVKITNGTLTSNGNLTLLSTPLKTARIGALSGSGNVIGDVHVQRYVSGNNQYKYISTAASVAVSQLQQYVPVTGSFDGASTGPGLPNAPSMYYYDEPAGGWIAFPESDNSELLVPGRGYAIYLWTGRSDTTLVMTGEVEQGEFDFTLTADPDVVTNNDDGWNLIGNPFPSAVQWGSTGWSLSGVNATAYVRDNNYPGGRFLVWDGSTGDEEFGGSIATGQSFWVRATSVSPSLTINEQAKNGSGDATFFRTEQNNEGEVVKVELRRDDLIDRTYIRLLPDASNEFDQEIDALKRLNGYFNISSLSKDSVSLAINNINGTFCNYDVPLELTGVEPGNYKLTASGLDINTSERRIWLIDSYLNEEFLLDGNTYSFEFTGDAKSYHHRFGVRLESTLPNPGITQSGNTLFSNSKTGNQWMLNGSPIEGATDPFYTPVVSGDYALQFSNKNCTKTSDSLPFVVTGFETRSQPGRFRVFPNPAHEYLHIQANAPSSMKYVIMDITGRQVQSGSISERDSEAGVIIHLTCDKGLYFLSLHTGEWTDQIKIVVE